MINGSLASIESIDLGGVKQWVLIRGKSERTPVILFLHGGPGNPQIISARRYQSNLEEHFVVVNWDQRGCGLSYSKDVSPESMTVDQIVSDSIELSQKLCTRFEKEKIYLIGHSWGTLIGILAIKKKPNIFRGYFGTGQFVSTEAAAPISFNWALDQARKLHNSKAENELKKYPDNYKIRRKWVEKFGGFSTKKGGFTHYAIDFATHLTEYSLFDLYSWGKGAAFSERLLVPQAEALDLRNIATSFSTPICLLEGQNDYVTPIALAKEYLDMLDAPKLEWVSFGNQSHMFPFDAPESFAQSIVRIVQDIPPQ